MHANTHQDKLNRVYMQNLLLKGKGGCTHVSVCVYVCQ
jgi:hypothetical protein